MGPPPPAKGRYLS
jgi:hypothetical protein